MTTVYFNWYDAKHISALSLGNVEARDSPISFHLEESAYGFVRVCKGLWSWYVIVTIPETLCEVIDATQPWIPIEAYQDLLSSSCSIRDRVS